MYSTLHNKVNDEQLVVPPRSPCMQEGHVQNRTAVLMNLNLHISVASMALNHVTCT